MYVCMLCVRACVRMSVEASEWVIGARVGWKVATVSWRSKFEINNNLEKAPLCIVEFYHPFMR